LERFKHCFIIPFGNPEGRNADVTFVARVSKVTVINFVFVPSVYLLYSISKEYNLEIATSKTKVFGIAGTDHLRAKTIINYETLDQLSHLTYLGCSIFYQVSNDVEL
jgi:hypothetical protein